MQSHTSVLIVEDEKTLAHALELKVGHSGFVTHVVSTGDEGLREALTGQYSVILLDLMLPGADGFAILQALREKSISTPVIVLTNLGQDKDRERAKSLGAKEYFVKADTPIAMILAKMKEVME